MSATVESKLRAVERFLQFCAEGSYDAEMPARFHAEAAQTLAFLRYGTPNSYLVHTPENPVGSHREGQSR